MGMDVDWTLKMKSKNHTPLTVDRCDEILHSLYVYIGYELRHQFNDGEFEIGFETSSNYSYENIPQILKLITKEHPDVVMSVTCKAGHWDYAEKANVSNGELEWLTVTLVYAEPRTVIY